MNHNVARSLAALLVAAGFAVTSCAKNTVSPAVSDFAIALSPQSLPAEGGTLTVQATVRTKAGTPLPGVDVQFKSTAGTLSAASVTSDSAGVASTTLQTTRGVTVTASTPSASVDVKIVLPDKIRVKASNPAPKAYEEVTFTFTAISDGLPLSGQVTLTFGDGESATFAVNNGSGKVTHTYSRPGGYNATANFTPPGGAVIRDTVRVEVAGFAVGADQIDPSLITWVGNENISNWAVTSTITDWSYSNGTVCIYHTKQGYWPLVSIDENPPNIEAQIGFVAKINGKWYGGAYDWMGEGRACKYEPPENWGKDQIREFPLDASYPGPQPGDEVGLYMSTPASFRIPSRSVPERTNIILVRWP